MILTLALLLIVAAILGLIALYRQLFQSMQLIDRKLPPTIDLTPFTVDLQYQLRDHDEADRMRQAELIGCVQRLVKATGKLIADTAEGAAIDTCSVKTQLASVRHDLSLDAGEQAKRFDGVEKLIAEEGKKTRKNQQEIKTRLADEEKVDQAAKRKARRMGPKAH